MASLAAQYEARYPGTGIPEAQKTERMERIAFKQERASHHRTVRTSSVVFSGPAGATLDRIFGGARHGA